MSTYLSELIEKGEADLRAYFEACKRPGFPALSSKESPYAVQQAFNLLPSDSYQPVQGPAKKTTATLGRLAGVLAAHMNNADSAAWPNQETLTKITGIQEKALKASIRGLRDAGLIGVVPGTKTVSSRYYFLFHTGSREAFAKHLDRLRAKILEASVDDHEIPMGDENDLPF